MYKKNDIVTIEITDMGVDGEGIGKVDGFTLFVKDALIGDVAEVKVMKAKKNYGYARLMKLVTPSADRVEPVCPVARQCGGCQIQALSYEKQLEFKQNKVKNNLIRIGGFSPEEIALAENATAATESIQRESGDEGFCRTNRSGIQPAVEFAEGENEEDNMGQHGQRPGDGIGEVE